MSGLEVGCEVWSPRGPGRVKDIWPGSTYPGRPREDAHVVELEDGRRACFMASQLLRVQPLLLKLDLEGEPIAKERPVVPRTGRAFTPKATTAAEDAIRWQLRAAGLRKPLGSEADLMVALRFFCSAAERDVDNLVKLVLDACNGFVWADDKQVSALHAERLLDPVHPRTELAVSLR